jgi:hypothetical protein
VNGWFFLKAKWIIFSYIIATTNYIQWNDDGVGFVLDPHTSSYSNNILIADMWLHSKHSILIPSQPAFGITP